MYKFRKTIIFSYKQYYLSYLEITIIISIFKY